MLLIKNGYMIDPKSGRDGKYDITFIDNIQYADRMLKIRVKKAVEQWET